MSDGRTFVGRVAERSLAAAALKRRRSVLITGPSRSGRSRLLSVISEDVERPIVCLEGLSCGVTWCGPNTSDRHEVTGRDDVMALLVALRGTAALMVDDLDLLPLPVLAPLIDAFRLNRAVFLAATSPRHVLQSGDAERWNLLRPLFEHSAATAVVVPLPPLALSETATLGDALRTTRYGVDRADDAWQMALHNLSGGSPALVRELVEAAAARGRLNALLAVEPQRDALPSDVVASVTKMIAPLGDRERQVLTALAELGPVPKGHLGSLVAPTVLARLYDGGLLSAGADAGTAAVSGVIARMVADSVDVVALGDVRRSLARELLSLAQHAPVLTRGEEMFCARWADPGDDEALASALSRILPRAAISLARSGSPRVAVQVAERVRENGGETTAASATILARLALGEYEEAERLLDAAPLPRVAEDRESMLLVHVRVLFATCARLDLALARLAKLTRWAPDDPVWRLRIEHAVAALSLASGTTPTLPDGIAALDTSADDETRVLAEACRAAVEASRGHRAGVHGLLRRRHETHGLDVESNFTVFRLHAFSLMMIGEDLDLVQNAARRRLLTARWEDRQDDVALLALIDASIQLIRGRPADVFASLQLIEVNPSEAVRIWCDVVRAAAFVTTGDLVHAASAIERIDGVSNEWGRGGFGAVRDAVCALFDMANHRPAAAAARVERIFDQARRTMPILLPMLLRVLLEGGEPVDKVLGRAEALATEIDIAPLNAFIDELRVRVRGSVSQSLELLTTREREIVQLVAGGQSNAQIAALLRLSVRTVESHLHHARTRLGMERHERFSREPRPSLQPRGR